MRVRMFSKSDCELCAKAKDFFAAYPNIPVDEIKLESQEMRNRIYDRFGLTGAARLMPQIILVEDDGTVQHIGGWKDLEQCGLQSLFI